MKKLLFVLIAGAVFCSVADAMAQMPDRPRVTGGTVTPSEPADVSQSRERGDDWRDGWMLGIGPLGGVPLNNGCESCSQSPAFGMTFHVGRMLNPRLALLLDSHAVAIGQSDIAVAGISTTSTVQGVVAISLQYWPAQRFWVKGGIGHGEAQGTVATAGSLYLKEEETGFGMIVATGYEIYQGGLFALDLQARYAGMHTEPKYRGNLALGLGFNWYP